MEGYTAYLKTLLEPLGIALPFVAEVVVVTGHQMDRAQVPHQGFL